MEKSPSTPGSSPKLESKGKRFQGKNTPPIDKEQPKPTTPDISHSSQDSNSRTRIKLQRRKQFGHRLTKYKRLGYTRKKFDIGKANKLKRGEKLQEKRDRKWLFTSLSQSTSKRKDSAKEEVSFESISALEGSYRQQQSTSSSSPEQSSDVSAK